jgi:hypothetical protein
MGHPGSLANGTLLGVFVAHDDAASPPAFPEIVLMRSKQKDKTEQSSY